MRKERATVGYSIFKYGSSMLTDIEDLDQAKKEALRFVTSTESAFIEVQDSNGQTVTIGYFDGNRFHWTKDKIQTEAFKSLGIVTKPPIWEGSSK